MTRRPARPRLTTARLLPTRRHRGFMDAWRARSLLGDAGMTTAEYAIGTVAACGFAALLVAVLKSGQVKGLLVGIVTKALALG